MHKSVFIFILLLLLIGGTEAMSENQMNLTVDFSKREGVPLLKKYALFNSGIVGLPQYRRDAHLLDPLRVDSLRIDLFMGEEGRPFARLVNGTENAMTYDFNTLDELVQLLDHHGVHPYWSWSYIPFPLQVDGNWRKGPSSLEQWQEMFRVFAEHYRQSGLRIAYHEIYNEPDCGDVFFLGTLQDYTQMYIAGARGLLSGDSDAVIGGPSTAFIDITGERQIRSFLSAVQEAEVPLDFFSYHSYGSDSKQYLGRTRLARSILSEFVSFDTTELHLNEFNSEIQPFLINGRAEHSIGGSTMLTAFELLLEETDVTLAHWAQFMDTGIEPLGSIDPVGRIKAPYWAYWMYSQMPEERVSLSGLGAMTEEGLHGMASADKETACILLWNDNAAETAHAQVSIHEKPFSSGTVETYIMNDAVDPYWNSLGEIAIKPAQTLPLEDCPTEINLDIPSGGFVLYRFVNDSGKAEFHEPIGKMIRKHYYFPERGKKSYAFFDETDQTVYLGMNGEYSARSIVGVEWEQLPQMVRLQSAHGGTYQQIDLNTSLSVRIDYAVDGVYTKAVLFTFMPINPRRDSSVPWGTGRIPDEIVSATSLMTGKTLLTLGAHAPEGWDGRAIITYDMHSTGPDTWIELTAAAK